MSMRDTRLGMLMVYEIVPYYLIDCLRPFRRTEFDTLFGDSSRYELSDGSGGYERGSNGNGSGGAPLFDTGEGWEDAEEHSYGRPAERSALI